MISTGKVHNYEPISHWFLILIFVFSCSKRKEEINKTNILLICVDDMGWSDLGCYGSEISTPNIDQLAKGGMRFTSFYNTAKCFPSRASLITGVYARDCGYDKSYKEPIRNAVTLGEVLQTAGYKTYWSGKHHGKENPYHRGFDHYFGLKDGAANHFNPGLQREGEPVPARKRSNRQWAIDSTLYEPYTPKEKDFYSTDYYTKYAIDFIKESADQETPFFLYLAYTAPHDPLMAWPEDIKKYEGMYDSGYGAIRKKRYEKQLELGVIDSSFAISEPYHPAWDSLSAEEKAHESKVMEVYAAMIDRMDQNVGKILQTLDSLITRENTLIIFVSDNGASAEEVVLDTNDDTAPIGSMARWIYLGGNWANVANTPFRYFKNYSHEGGINTPMIVNWPGKVQASTYSNYPGHFIDFMATFVDLTNAQYPKEFNGQEITPMRGKSLLPVFQNPDLEKREDPLFWEWQYGKAIREGEWKLVKWGNDSEWELYHIATDPTELNDLAASNKSVVDSLKLKFESWSEDQFFD